MKFSDAVKLQYGMELYFSRGNNADGSPQKYRVTGKVRRWKRTPMRLEIPVRRGLRQNARIETNDLPYFFATEEDAVKFRGREVEQFNEKLLVNPEHYRNAWNKC